ncbi:hypothetical protein TNCT_406711 [Trichonephila clavata]|uniref:SOCS box domain-containing protein n=1 Tax=Trichonephila clavata TaxID=2740835 RepID=A0A8X6G980_TRICU|nr:hypothetical protein TNCT_406711 [Trichonephila clavata]
MPLEKEKLGRRAIVTEVLLFLLKFGISASPHMRQSVVKCFNLLWSVSPDPLVTIPEIENEIQFRFQHPPEYRTRFRCFPDTQEHFMKLTGMIQIECTKTIALVFEPRTLQHLCKCNIRTLLLKAGNLPRGIKYLGLPYLLESYMNVYI